MPTFNRSHSRSRDFFPFSRISFSPSLFISHCRMRLGTSCCTDRIKLLSYLPHFFFFLFFSDPVGRFHVRRLSTLGWARTWAPAASGTASSTRPSTTLTGASTAWAWSGAPSRGGGPSGATPSLRLARRSWAGTATTTVPTSPTGSPRSRSSSCSYQRWCTAQGRSGWICPERMEW